MKKSKKIVSCTVLFLFLVSLNFYSSLKVFAKNDTINQKDIKLKADTYLTNLYNLKKFNGTVLIVKDNIVVFNKNYGMANMALNAPITNNTKFAIASITKQFTAAAILKLQEQGSLNTSDTLSKYIPEYTNGKNITLHMLLTHTSGIADYGADYFNESIKHYSPNELIALFKDKPIYSEPGKQFAYVNSDYILLGYIIEKVSGMTYEDYVTKNIIEKADLQNTCFSVNNSIVKNVANGYSAGGLDTINAAYIDMSYPYSAGELYSTAADLHKWNDALINGRVIDKNSWSKMSAPYVETGWTPGLSYGYGLMLFDKKIGSLTKKAICHGGVINGFTSSNYIIPEDNLQLIVLSNIDYTYSTIEDDLLSICYGEKYKEIPVSANIINIDDKELDSYIGAYSDGNPINGMTITKQGNTLFINLNAPYKYPVAMYPTYNGKDYSLFKNDLISHEFKFYKDAEGNIIKMDELLSGSVIDIQTKIK